MGSAPLPEDFVGLLVALGGGPGGKAKLATDIGQSYWKIRPWYRNNYVPDWAWADLMRLARSRGLTGVNIEYLYSLSQKGVAYTQRGKHKRMKPPAKQKTGD